MGKVKYDDPTCSPEPNIGTHSQQVPSSCDCNRFKTGGIATTNRTIDTKIKANLLPFNRNDPNLDYLRGKRILDACCGSDGSCVIELRSNYGIDCYGFDKNLKGSIIANYPGKLKQIDMLVEPIEFDQEKFDIIQEHYGFFSVLAP